MKRKFSKGEIAWVISMLALMFVLIFTSCTKTERAKRYGGSFTIDLPENTKFVNATWKENNLWYITRDMDSTDVAQTYKFKEKSNYGVMQGTVIFVEHKTPKK